MPVNLSENFDIGAVLGDPRGTNEDCLDRPASEADLKRSLEATHLATEGVALGANINQSEVITVEHDQPRAGAEDRLAGAMKCSQWLCQ